MTNFTGQIASDFLKLFVVEDKKKIDQIDFAAQDFLSLRDALINYIKAVYPLDYNNFVESDLGMMLVELVSYMGAVMSMKADILANENFLRTAKLRNNVKKLLELIGVTMKGPISSAANARLTVNSVASQSINIPKANRVVTITSPEDNAPLNFTLYKVVNGIVDTANSTANITLTLSESDAAAGLVWENLAMLEGALVVQTGTFNSVESIKKIDLTESPVAEGSVDLFITGDSTVSGAWERVDNLFFASGSTDNIFQVVYDDNFTATILFGDGIVGNSPPLNATYTVTYRVGGGTRGNIANGVINAVQQYTEGVTNKTATIENTSMATGGSDAETVEHAKKYAPLTFKRQDRLVTLEDFTSFVNSYISPYSTMGKGRAVTRKAYSSANYIDVYVLEKASTLQLQKASESFKLDLLEKINEKKMLTDEVIICDGLIRALDLIITIKVDNELTAKEEIIKGLVKNTVLDFFSPDSFDFGKTLSLSDLNRSIFTNVDEVRYSTVDNLDKDIHVDFNELIQLNNLVINVVFV